MEAHAHNIYCRKFYRYEITFLPISTQLAVIISGRLGKLRKLIMYQPIFKLVLKENATNSFLCTKVLVCYIYPAYYITYLVHVVVDSIFIMRNRDV